MKTNYIGKEYLLKCGDIFMVDRKSSQKYGARYLYEGHFKGYNRTIIRKISEVIIGNIANPDKRNEYGFLCDINIEEEDKHIYNIWKNMEKRCYHPNESNYKGYGNKGIIVSEEFKTFSYFRNWYLNQHVKEKDFNIDKDCKSIILGIPRMYSEQTCMLIPSCINTFLSTIGKGIYDTGHNTYIVRLRRKHMRFNISFKTIEDAIEFKKEKDLEYLNMLLDLYNLNKETITYLKEYVKIFRYPSVFPRNT